VKRRIIIQACALVFTLVIYLPAESFLSAQSTPASLYRDQQKLFQDAVQKVSPYMVTIETVGGTQPPAQARVDTQPADSDESEKQRKPEVIPGAGSSFIIADGPTTGLIYSPDGLILTSTFNFVRNPSVITVVLHDGRRFVGELLARDEIRKLAMIKIEANHLPVPKWITNQDHIQVGQWAIALGRGFGRLHTQGDIESSGQASSISVGIISGLNRISSLAIQTDARLSPANFGGPLIGIQGRLLGICVPMSIHPGQLAGVEWYDSGIGFAIPYWQIKKTAEDLAVGHNIRRGLLGVAIDQQVTDGVRISGIANPSPAQRYGLQAGDSIIAINDQTITNYTDLKRIMRPLPAGQWIKLRIMRDDEERELKIILAVPEDLGKF